MTQHEALDILKLGGNVYLTGQAGSGKTYVLNKYINYLRKNKTAVAVTATTGIAATHLGGTTIHSWSGLGIFGELSRNDIAKLVTNKKTQSRIKSAKTLIIDEISMLHGYRLDLVDQICKMAREDQRPFGGLQLVLCGDFFQLPPIDEQNRPLAAFAFGASSWNEANLQVCYIDEQHRQFDSKFLNILNAIRTNEVEQETYDSLMSRHKAVLAPEFFPTRLYTHNVDVDTINFGQISKLETASREYFMHTHGNNKVIEALKKGCLAPEILIVKIGAIVMFIKNNFEDGYVNGTLGKVTGFEDNGWPVVETTNGLEIVAAPVEWTIEDEGKVLGMVSQIPLRLAWAITIHKSQGMSLDSAEIDLSRSFAYGMGYVALSRVRSLEGMRLLGINPMALRVDEKVSEMDGVFRKQSKELAHALTKSTKFL